MRVCDLSIRCKDLENNISLGCLDSLYVVLLVFLSFFFLSNVLIFLKLLETIFREWKLRYEGNFCSRSGVYSDEKITFERKIRENFIAYSLSS